LFGSSSHGAAFNFSAGQDGRVLPIIISDCPSDSDWFSRFSQGMKKRMGQDVRPQLGFSVEVMLVLLRSLEESWQTLPNGSLKDDTLGALAYSSQSFTNWLRGNEGFKLDPHGLRSHLFQGTRSFEVPSRGGTSSKKVQRSRWRASTFAFHGSGDPLGIQNQRVSVMASCASGGTGFLSWSCLLRP
jgi:hypothetical protein